MLNIFDSYMYLEYTRGIRPRGLKDYTLGGLTILRTTETSWTIHYLKDGSRLEIPWPWIDLFEGLNIHSGDQILYQKPEGRLEEFIFLMTSLLTPGSEILGLLEKICTIGTGEFRKYIKEKHGIHLDPFTYKSLTKTLEI